MNKRMRRTINPENPVVRRLIRRRVDAIRNRMGHNAWVKLDLNRDNHGDFVAVARTFNQKRPIVCHALAADPITAIVNATEHMKRKVNELKNRRKHRRHEVTATLPTETEIEEYIYDNAI